MSDFVAGDTNSVLVVTCKDQDGALINLGGYTVTLRWRYIANGPMTKRATMTNDDQVTLEGQAHYRWLAGELIAPTMFYDVVIREEETQRYVTQLDEVTLKIRAKAEDPDTSASPSSSRSPSSSFSASPSASPSAS